MLTACRLSSRVYNTSIRRRIVRSSTRLSKHPQITFGTRLGVRLTALGVAGGTFFLLDSRVHADADTEQYPSHRNPTSLTTLLRSYIVYSLCSVPVLVDYSPTILTFLTSIPGVGLITEAVVRSTFFAQFVGGDTAQGTIPLLTQLRAQNKGVLLGYSVEVDQNEAGRKIQTASDTRIPARHKQNVEEIIKCIDVASEFEQKRCPAGASTLGRKTWVAVKITALLPSAQSLISLSDHIHQTRPELSPPIPFPGCPHPSDLAFIESGASAPKNLTDEDVVALKDLYYDLHRIAERGAQRGVRVIVDAEYSWFQPAIDAFTSSLMRRFNKLPRRGETQPSAVQPLVFTTFQAYLKRTPAHLLQTIQDAKAGGYSLGIKLVRGAYHPFEVDASSSEETCPVWPTKKDTDACYNKCVTLLLSALRNDLVNEVPRLGILFGTHNSQSCDKILGGLLQEGVAEERDGVVDIREAVAERCAIGQLFGMSDSLTNRLVDRIRSPSPFVIKYVPYGPLTAVMPYLCRRAIENKSVMSGEGGAIAERRRAGAEIRKRLLGL